MPPPLAAVEIAARPSAAEDATPDPVVPHAAAAIDHLNVDHSYPWLSSRALGGYPDTRTAQCTGADRYGLDLKVVTDRGVAYTRIGYPKPLTAVHQMRAATVELVRRVMPSLIPPFRVTRQVARGRRVLCTWSAGKSVAARSRRSG